MIKKRGQISIFLVIALILLIAGSVYFYYQSTGEDRKLLKDPKAQEVKNYIEACIQQTALEGMKILGINGGYIYFPDQIKKDPRTYLHLGPIDNVKNPYWWFDGKEAIPTEDFMEQQIARYIKEHLDSCIDSVAASQHYAIKKDNNPGVEVVLQEDDVAVKIFYPIEISYADNSKVNLQRFQYDVPVKLKKIYELAKDIMNAENRDSFLEFKTIDLITLDEEIPTTDIVATCEKKEWYLPSIQEKLKRLLATNIPYINIQNTEFADSIYVPNPYGEDNYKSSYFNSHYQWLISEKKYDNLRVGFEYNQNWPLQLYARPSDGKRLVSNSQTGGDILKFLCLHIWHFTYDVVYPVRVSIIDSHGSEPFAFSFAFKVSVDHNQPRRELFPFTIQQDQGIEENAVEFCKDRQSEIFIYTWENSSDEHFIDDVNLTYTCGIYSCPIGKTEWLSYGAAAGLSSQFPFCNNGFIRAKRQGYQDVTQFFSTEYPGTYNIHMRPVKEFLDYDVIKHDFDNPAKEKKLDENEKVSIFIKSAQENFESNGVVPHTGTLPLKLFNDQHQYELSLYITDGESLTGGYQTTWNVNKAIVDNAKKITFHVLEKKGSEEDQLLFITGLAAYSQQIPQPQFT